MQPFGGAAFQRKARAGFAIAVIVAASDAAAISISLTEKPEGEPLNLFGIPGNNAGPAPASVTGGGTLSQVMSAAANYWEGVFLDSGPALDIDYGWRSLSSDTTLATALDFQTRDFGPPDAKRGIITFNNTETAFTYYADPNPTMAEDFDTYFQTTAELGGGEMNTGRVFTDRTGPAAGAFDLFSIAVHEMGHLLGLDDIDTDANPLEITSGPYAGASIATLFETEGHLDGSAYPYSLMQRAANGDRRLASDVDIAAIAELSGFNDVDYGAANLTMAPVPLQPAAALLAGAIGLMVMIRGNAGRAHRERAA